MHFLSRIFHLLALAGVLSSANPLAAQSGAPADHGKGNDPAARIHRIEASTVDISMGEGQPRLRLTLTELMHAYNDPAFSIAVIDNFQIDWANGYGVTAAGSSMPVTAHTIFQAASISKPVTAAAALSLVEHGKLTLDEDVNVKLIHWKVPENELTKTEKVTLRRILSHSAGLTVHGFSGYGAGDPIPSVEACQLSTCTSRRHGWNNRTLFRRRRDHRATASDRCRWKVISRLIPRTGPRQTFHG